MRIALTVCSMVAILTSSACSSTPEPDTTITLAEYVIGVESELDAGSHVIELTNVGAAHHNLTICPAETAATCGGEGIELEVLRKPEQARDPSIIPDRSAGITIGRNWTAIVEVELAPGTYRFFCGVIGHAERGMRQLVTVS